MTKLLAFFLASTIVSAANIYASFEVLAKHQSKLAFGTVGVISELNVQLGDRVKKGDVLARLNSSVELAQKDAALAQLNLASSKLKRANVASSALSKSVLDEANAAKALASAQLSLANAAISLKTLKAPFDGIIAAKLSEVGDGIASPAQPVLMLLSQGDVELALSFDVKFINQVKVGDEFEFSHNNKLHKVKITRIAPMASPIDRKVSARAIYSGGDLLAGSYGEGYIIDK